MVTVRPERARTMPAASPAMPPPTTMTCLLTKQRILPDLWENRAQGRPYPNLCPVKCSPARTLNDRAEISGVAVLTGGIGRYEHACRFGRRVLRPPAQPGHGPIQRGELRKRLLVAASGRVRFAR